MKFWLFRGAKGAIWILLALLVGIPRIWVGVHYPADILVGAMISIVTALIAFHIVPKLSILQKLLGIYEKGESYPTSKER